MYLLALGSIVLLYMFMSFVEGVAKAAYKDWECTRNPIDLVAFTIATVISVACIIGICYLAAPYMMLLH
ncbi:hypothetical protein CZP2022_34 [Vibrio phage C-ZP2022]|nr:hypothetical protein CZP2022_34 [Vibrio phage C-ZP2022]